MYRFVLQVLIFVLFSFTYLYCTTFCFYYDGSKYVKELMTKPTCEYYCSLIDNCKLLSLRSFSLEKYYDTVILVGMGSYSGLFVGTEFSDPDYNVITWKELAEKLHCRILVVDACYAGYIFDFEYPNIDTIITSTYKENSWNIEIEGKWIGSLALTLRCMFDRNYTCPYVVDLSRSISYNQLCIIFQFFSKLHSFNATFYNWERPSIGTCTMNNKVCDWR